MTTSPSRPAGGAFAGLMGRPYLLLVLTNLFWGGNTVAGKLAVGHVDAFSLTFLRWSGALLVVLPFAFRGLRRDWPVLRSRWWLYLFYGAVGYVTFNILVYVAAYHTSGVNIAIEQVAINMLVMLINFALFRTAVQRVQLIGVGLTILGVALTATHGDLGRLLTLQVNLGDALVLAACVAYAVYSVALRWRPATSWLSFLAATLLGATIASLFYQEALGGGVSALAANLARIDALGWAIALYTILLPSVVSQVFYVRGVELIGSNRASLFINLIPLFGTIGSVLVLGEALQGFHLAAGALIIIGIVLAEWSARRPA